MKPKPKKSPRPAALSVFAATWAVLAVYLSRFLADHPGFELEHPLDNVLEEVAGVSPARP